MERDVALDPYRRFVRKHRPGIDEAPKASRVPWVIGGLGLIAMLALVYNLSVSGISSTTKHLFSSHVQAPP